MLCVYAVWMRRTGLKLVGSSGLLTGGEEGNILCRDYKGILFLSSLSRKPATHDYRQLCPNFLLLWIKVDHYYG